MSTSSGNSTGSSTAHYLTTITAQDHSAYLWIASVIALCFSLCSLVVRLLVKWLMLATDDALMGAGQAVALVHHALFFVAIANGLGKAESLISPSQMIISGKVG
jgi:hypothetical protein